ncbi:unnamed protein product [Ilex paraguariensis]|uniref:C2 domain-containing protein n=1 Tax=Ilex paraguariensis TaxID=185542 RepID=A0ABC8QU13_9AQUA
MATTSRPQLKPYDVDISIVSAKHLKNVNWRHGDLKPYVIFWVDPDRRLATKSDDSGSTRPVWNERFVLPLTLSPQDSFLTLEIFHSKPSETPKPLVGTLRFPLKDLGDSDDFTKLRTFEVRRPSGRPQGKIRLKLAVRERFLPDYHSAPPQPSFYYHTAPPAPPSTRDYRGYTPSPYASLPPTIPPAATVTPSPSLSPPPPPQPLSYTYGSYSDPYTGYYSAYYSRPPPPPPPPFIDRQTSYGGAGPSAPVDYASPYDQKAKSGKMGLGTGLAVGAVAGALGGLALEGGLKYEEERIADKVESDLSVRDDYSEYRVDYLCH